MPNDKQWWGFQQNAIILVTKWNKIYDEIMMIWKWEGNEK